MARRYGTRPYFLAQLGPEATPGTAVPGTALWRGVFGGWKDERDRQTVAEDIGIQTAAERIYDTKLGASVTFPDTPLTFEQICYLLEAAVGKVTPSGSGPYVRDYAFSLTDTPNTLQTYTIITGNKLVTTDIKAIPYCIPTEVTLSGKAGEAWTVSGSWMGARAVAGTFAALSVPDVEDAIFSNTTLFVDASGGTIGTTQKTGVLIGAQIKITPAVEFVPPGDGVLYPTVHKQGRPKVSVSLTYEYEENTVGPVSFVAAERAAYEAKSIRLVRLLCAGGSGREMQLDMAIRYDSVSEPQFEGDTNATVTFEGHADYSAADALMFAASISNNVATL